MPLPPATKLPLAVRKDVRDEFENNKSDWEDQIKEILGIDWKIEINPLAIYPYAEEDYPKTRLGSCLKGYVEGAIYRLKYFLDQYGEDGKKEINDVCFARTLGMVADERDKKKICSYTDCKVNDGALILLYNPKQLGTNSGDSLALLLEALNEASQVSLDKTDAPTVLSAAARLGISKDYQPKLEDLEEKFREITKNDKFIVDPNWEENYAKIKAYPGAVKDHGEDWERRMGFYTASYFDGAIYKMNYLKIGEDDMLQEGFNEAIENGKIVIRIVPKLERGISSYCEAVVKDGVLFIQTVVEKWGINTGDALDKLLDIL